MVADNSVFRKKFAHNFGIALDRAGFKTSGFGRVKAVAETFGVSTTSAQKWLTAAALPEMQKLPEFCVALKCTLDDLVYGFDQRDHPRTNESNDATTIRIISNTSENAAIISKEMFSNFWWKTGLVALQVEDDTMEPFVSAGEYVFFEQISATEQLNGVYVLLHAGLYVTRRLQETMDYTVRIICENKRFTAEEIPLHRIRFNNPQVALVESDFITVIGRVVGRMLMR
jgi:hypothetical protein